MKKKNLVLAVMIIALCFISACSMKKKDDGKLHIVCTIFPQYDFVKQITKDIPGVEVSMLLKPGQESHDYDPSSKDILAIHNADMFIYVGGESDTWIDDVLSTVTNDKQIRLALMDMVDVHEEEDVNEHGHNHEHDEEEEYDEHVWTSPANAVKITKVISDKLLNIIDEKNKNELKESTDKYIEELNSLDTDIREVVDNSKKKYMVVADRFPLLYFCKEYGIEYYAAFSGCATNVEPSTGTLIRMIDKVKELDLKYIFTIEMSAKTTANQVAAETGADILTFYSCHNVTTKELNNGVTYVSLMRENLDSLKKALN